MFALVAGNQERRFQYKTRMSKEDFNQRRDDSENIQYHWAMESGKGLLSIQYAGFHCASHLKHWILKMIVWHEMVREKVKARKPPR